MEESDFEFENDTDSMFDSFDLPQYNLSGLRIFLGRRRASSIEVGDRQDWNTLDTGIDDNEDDGSEFAEDDLSVLDRGFVDSNDPVAQPMGQAIDLALRLLETQKSIDIMAHVARRLVEDSRDDVWHITPQSTLRECKTLVRNWIAKLRHQEFFKIQAVGMSESEEIGGRLRCWHRRVHPNDTPTLADYYPHNAGVLEIDFKIIRNLAYHASSRPIDSAIEFQKCLFYVARLLVHEVQFFWIAFLMSKMSQRGAREPAAVFSDTTIALRGTLSEPSAGHHWEVEFFGGVVRNFHYKDNPCTDFNKFGGFGRGLSVGYAFLNRVDGTQQRIEINSIIGCVEYDFSEVLLAGLSTCGNRVLSGGFYFLDYDSYWEDIRNTEDLGRSVLGRRELQLETVSVASNVTGCADSVDVHGRVLRQRGQVIKLLDSSGSTYALVAVVLLTHGEFFLACLASIVSPESTQAGPLVDSNIVPLTETLRILRRMALAARLGFASRQGKLRKKSNAWSA